MTEKDNPNITDNNSPEAKESDIAKSRLIKFLSHPVIVAVGLFGSIASLVSIPLAFYFYFQAKEYPQLAFYVNPAKAVVVRANESSRLTTIYEDKVIHTDITAVQVAIWNKGKKPVRGTDILKPITIYTENNAPILEASLRKTSRNVIRLGLDDSELQHGRVTVSWNILEHNDGGVIQIIYAGTPGDRLSVDGVIEGQMQIEEIGQSVRTMSIDEYNKYIRDERNNTGVILIVLSSLLLSFLVYSIFSSRKFNRKYAEADRQLLSTLDVSVSKLSAEELNHLHEERRASLERMESLRSRDWMLRAGTFLGHYGIPALAVVMIVLLVIGVYLLLWTQESGPPFGF